MNAAQARREARRKAGVQERSDRMAEWLERKWEELEEALVEHHHTEEFWQEWRRREDEWLENLKKYEAQVDRERG